MRILLVFIFLACPVLAGTNYVIVVDSTGTKELASYDTTMSVDEVWTRESAWGVPVFVTKAEYEGDKDVPEKDRLKKIPKAKITTAIAAAPDKIAEAKWNSDADARTATKLAGKDMADFIAEYKKEATNTTVSAVSP